MDIVTIMRQAEDKKKRITRVTERLEGREVRVVDATGALDAEAERVVEFVSSLGLPAAVADALDPAAPNIRLVLEDEQYDKDGHDPHDDDLRGMAVQST